LATQEFPGKDLPMKPRLIGAALLFASTLPCLSSTAAGDTFGSGGNRFEIEFVAIGNPANAPDTLNVPDGRPHGAVDYAYRIGKYEVSTDALNKANAAGNLDIYHEGHQDVPPQFRYEPSRPAYYLSWYGAAAFVNWMNVSTGYVPAYKFDGEGNFQLWDPTDPGYNPENQFRNSLTNYVLPDVDEWFKAAYYDGENNAYYDYPTGSNSIPDGIDFEGDPLFDAVFSDGYEGKRPHDYMNAGVASPYGTVGQGGNVWEWEETSDDYLNDVPDEPRARLGGDYNAQCGTCDPTGAWLTGKWHRSAPADPLTQAGVGFRVASLVVLSRGDLDLDGDVDGADFLRWQRQYSLDNTANYLDSFHEHYGRSVLGDHDLDGDVDGADFLQWQRGFGVSYGASDLADWKTGFLTASATESGIIVVPEPATSNLALALMGLAACWRRTTEGK
jgi:formylglycine-generating enzyme required for sulfatase activity